VATLCASAPGATAVVDAKAPTATYIVQMAEPPAASYRGGQQGLAPTKPAPGRKVDPANANVRRYAAHLDNRHSAALQAAGAPGTAKFYDFRYSFNGFAAILTPAQVARLQADPAVARVEQDSLQQPTTDNTPSALGLDAPGGLWAHAGGQGRAGEDVIVGVIDTGIWPEHPSFSDQTDLADRPGQTGKRSLAYGPPPAHWRGTCQAGERWSKDDCNNKLIGARFFLAGFRHYGISNDQFESPRDSDGHGTHTASTAAGNAGVDPSIFGRDLGVGTISGMAPRARVAAYKACWEGGCTTSDLVAAIDAAVADGVDVINYSIGSDTPSLLSPDAVSFLFAADANVFAAISAGNAGPDAATVGSPASAPWVTAVGASAHDRTFRGSVTLGNGATYQGASVVPGLGTTPIVDGAAAGSLGCEAGELDPAVVTGKIVLCEGSRLRAARGLAVKQAGGVGMVLYNAPDRVDFFSDNHYVPAVHLSHQDGLAVRAYIAGEGPGATASLAAGSAADNPSAPYMAQFSSRGPNGASGDVLKPDVTAPGVQVLAGNTPVALGSAPGQLFQAISGTSMSGPHVAGVGALLVQAHRTWTPAMIRSALMTTAHQDVEKEDRATPADPFDFGAGHIAPNPANDPGLVYDVGFLDYIAFLCGADALDESACLTPAPGGYGVTPIDPSNLNLPSLTIDGLAGTQTLTRRVTNAGSSTATYAVTVDAPPGVLATVNPPTLTLAAGASAAYDVTFTVTDPSGGEWRFGSLTWSGDGGRGVRSPLAVRPVLLSAPDEVIGTGTSGAASWDVTFGYTGPFAADSAGLVAATVTDGTVVDDPANDINVALETGVGITEHVISVVPGTEHLRVALFDDAVNGLHDLDLYLFDPSGNFVDGSGSATSAEQVDAEAPAAGDWKVVVHGWQTDGSDAAYQLFTWRVPGPGAEPLLVTAPAVATIGQTAPVTAGWSGLAGDTRYLGAVRYVGAGGAQIGRTLVAVDT
jgi:subtilisin family serine protease